MGSASTGVSLAKFLSGLDWQALLFVGLVFVAMVYLLRLDREKRINLAHFIADRDGVGNSASLAYVVALLVSTWSLFYLTTHNRLEEWFFTGYIGVFVGGGVLRAAIGSRERTAALGMAPVSTEEKTVISKTVTTADAAGVWLAIDKAPQDGTVVLLLVDGNPDGVPGAYVDGAWRTESGDIVAPTHYMPRPRSP